MFLIIAISASQFLDKIKAIREKSNSQKEGQANRIVEWGCGNNNNVWIV